MTLTESEHMELQQQVSARKVRADVARRARLILLLPAGSAWADIQTKLDCSIGSIDLWAKRFSAERLAGLFSRHAGCERFKVTDLIPPQNAAVFCVDEKTATQALDRKDPESPPSLGRVERHGFEYYRHATLSLWAAFDTKTGEVIGKTPQVATPRPSLWPS